MKRALALAAVLGLCLYLVLSYTRMRHCESVAALIRKGALVVDVRTPEEFRAWQYPGAVNIPLNDIESRLSDFGDKNSPVVVYCRSGNRSSQAKKILERHGYACVVNGGGIADMKKIQSLAEQ